ncbi:hypothetical protein ABW19_dt0210036 [Dactylella cylindrospora]|nr:hypothetical protein ABW19_dt0210036 [Dactylella cylindrospora]
MILALARGLSRSSKMNMQKAFLRNATIISKPHPPIPSMPPAPSLAHPKAKVSPARSPPASQSVSQPPPRAVVVLVYTLFINFPLKISFATFCPTDLQQDFIAL